jgi:hypothetical protein
LAGQCQAVVLVNSPADGPIIIGLDGVNLYYEVYDPQVAYSHDAYSVGKNAVQGTGNLLAVSNPYESYTGIIGNSLFSVENPGAFQCVAGNCPATWAGLPMMNYMNVPEGLVRFKSPSPQHAAQYGNSSAMQLSITWIQSDNTEYLSYSETADANLTSYSAWYAAYPDSVYWTKEVSNSSGAIVDSGLYSATPSSTTAAHLAGSPAGNMFIVDVNSQSVLLNSNDRSTLY